MKGREVVLGRWRYPYDKDRTYKYREQFTGRAALYEGEDDMANVNGHVYFIRLKVKG